MNVELQALVLALEAVNEAGPGEEAKRLEAIFKDGRRVGKTSRS